MARSTQFIGLTFAANEFLNSIGAKQVPSEAHATGMFGEKVPLTTYLTESGDKYQEVVQAEPWSSGSMIFTALEQVEEGQNNPKLICPWVEDPMIVGEFSHKNGTYFV